MQLLNLINKTSKMLLAITIPYIWSMVA